MFWSGEDQLNVSGLMIATASGQSDCPVLLLCYNYWCCRNVNNQRNWHPVKLCFILYMQQSKVWTYLVITMSFFSQDCRHQKVRMNTWSYAVNKEVWNSSKYVLSLITALHELSTLSKSFKRK